LPEQAAFPLAVEPRAAHTGMEPTRHGWPFVNAYAWERRSRRLGPVRLSSGHVIYGLCGGMCFAALDAFYAGIPMPALEQPPTPGTPLYRYLRRRQLDSWAGPLVPLRTLWWMARSDRSAARATLQRELPRLLKLLDGGQPVPILLVRLHRGNPLGNHQVVATGYGYDPVARCISLEIYDPNHPGQRVELALQADPASKALHAIQSTGEPARGFFLQRYRPRKEGLERLAISPEGVGWTHE